MLFNSFQFLFFFAIVYIFYRALPFRWQNYLLLLASYLFYAGWDWRFLSLILISTIVDYFCGLHIHNSAHPRKRKLLLLVSLVTNLTLLGFFKYFNFFSENFAILLSFLGLKADMVTLKIVLPVGISFYTFQTLSYTIDIYRKQLEPERFFPHFALFVSFFPQLVAGPIERARNLLPQITHPRHINASDVKEGLWFVLWGYFLKVFIADRLAMNVDVVFNSLDTLSGFEAIIGIYSFTFQLFGDFAGYSSIAIGISRMMGFKLMTNFLFPYFVTNPSARWHHWHISLSSWLRDYLYIPMGGNRKGRTKTYRNVFLTMLIGGLWHGAAWNFVLWGVYHGVILVLHRMWLTLVKARDKAEPSKVKIIIAVKMFLMFNITSFGNLLFRIQDMHHLNLFFKALFFRPFLSGNGYRYMMTLIITTVALNVINAFQYHISHDHSLNGFPRLAKVAIVIILFYSIVVGGVFDARQFIYFQF